MKKNKGHILITRALTKESPLWQLSQDGYHIIDCSFLDITAEPITEIPKSEVYFYYSKNGAKHFVQAANSIEFDLKQSKHAAMGEGTANTLTKYGVDVEFIGSGTPIEIAKKLIALYSNSSICFVRAEQSTQSIQEQWPHTYSEVIAYRVSTKILHLTEAIHTIIATSPMNLKCAMNSCNRNQLERIICIGPTTYAAAKKYNNINVVMAKESNERALLRAFYQENIS